MGGLPDPAAKQSRVESRPTSHPGLYLAGLTGPWLVTDWRWGHTVGPKTVDLALVLEFVQTL